MRCENCLFWQRWKEGSDDGNCRKHSPVVVSDPDGNYSSVWPNTKWDDDCGDQATPDGCHPQA